MESHKQPHLKIEKEKAQKFIKYIKKNFKGLSILTNKFKTIKQEDFILFPLNNELPDYEKVKDQLNAHLNCEIINTKAIANSDYKPRSLEKALDKKIPQNLMKFIPKSFDIIGDIAIVELNQFDNIERTDNIKELIAQAIITVNKNIKTVYEKISEIEGTLRLRDLEHLAGKNRTETIHKENNCKFKLDVKKTFFSPRLNYERQRVSHSNIKTGEKIVDMFSGVGPFSIQIAKINVVKIYAFDINPIAIKYLQENINMNKLQGVISPFNKNIRTLLNPTNSLANSLKHNIDRIIMNLPKTSLSFMDVVSYLSKKEGTTIHNYQICSKPESIRKAIKNLEEKFGSFELKLEGIKHARIVKSYSPKEDMISIDAFIKNTLSDY
ncbi:MAG: class I SAM-dependent methyltransferase family protein [Promethearchaeota archaeon]|nr:MAG: class I SAM-dependent methyltransferase family protein [Candidatus Lokiarchaeota archaeon]